MICSSSESASHESATALSITKPCNRKRKHAEGTAAGQARQVNSKLTIQLSSTYRLTLPVRLFKFVPSGRAAGQATQQHWHWPPGLDVDDLQTGGRYTYRRRLPVRPFLSSVFSRSAAGAAIIGVVSVDRIAVASYLFNPAAWSQPEPTAANRGRIASSPRESGRGRRCCCTNTVLTLDSGQKHG